MILTNKKSSLFWLCYCVCIIAAIINYFVFTGTNELVVDKAQISINVKGERVLNDQPFTGVMTSYHPNGKQASADAFVNGRRNGFSRKWFKDGVLGFESHYTSGKRTNMTRSWWFNGKPRSEMFYVAGKPEGEAWRWYRSGAKFKKFNYVNGQVAGLQQAWRKNGSLYSNFEYKNGRIYGLRKANNCVGLEDEVISFDYYASQNY